LLGLRYVSDGAVSLGGWRIGKITLGDQVVSDGGSLKGWRSPTMIVPTPVHAWHVSLVGIDGKRARLGPVDQVAPLQGGPQAVGSVAYAEPAAQSPQYAPYRRVVTGAPQPGGASDANPAGDPKPAGHAPSAAGRTGTVRSR